jgi:hypothetical protein
VDRPGPPKRPSNISPRSTSFWKTSNIGARSAIAAVCISDTHVAGRDMVPYEAQALFLTEDADVTVGPMPKGFLLRQRYEFRSTHGRLDRKTIGSGSRAVQILAMFIDFVAAAVETRFDPLKAL